MLDTNAEQGALSVAGATAALIAGYGGKHLFTLTGAPQNLLIEAQNRADVKVVLARTERSAVAMADAYARLSGTPTFCFAQSGPGVAVLASGLLEAAWARSPVIGIGGSVSTRTRHRFEYQEHDQLPWFGFARSAAEIPSPDRIADMFRSAVRAAMSPSPGPSFLSFPNDWFTKSAGPGTLHVEGKFTKLPSLRFAPAIEDIEAAAAVVRKASKPVIIAGDGVLISEAWNELTSFAEATGMPVVTSLAGKGAISELHPLAIGVGGRYSRKVANDVLSACDLCIAIGTRLSSVSTDAFRFPKPGTTIVHIDLDASSLGRNYQEAVSAIGDPKVSIEMLAEALRTDAGALAEKWSGWTRDVQGQVKAWRGTVAKGGQTKSADGAINPVFVLNTLNRFLAEDDIVVADTGYMSSWLATLLDQKRAGRQLLKAAGSLGWAFPAAFGARMFAKPSQKVIGLSGDGGVGYHIGDLETALRLGLPVIQIVMNNASLGFEYHLQQHEHRELCNAAYEYLDVDFASVARGFGCHGERVVDPDKLEGALQRALNSGKPAIIDIVVSREVPAPVTRYEAVGLRDF